MKYIRKYNESATGEKNEITQKDFENIENLFLDYDDDNNLKIYQSQRFLPNYREVENSTLATKGGQILKLRLEIDLLKNLNQKGTYKPPKKDNRDNTLWDLTDLGFSDPILFDSFPNSPISSANTHDTSIHNIKSERDIILFVDRARELHQQQLRAEYKPNQSLDEFRTELKPLPTDHLRKFLNETFDIEYTLRDLLSKAKPIEHYGFDWNIELYLSRMVNRSSGISFPSGPAYDYKVFATSHVIFTVKVKDNQQ